MLAVDPEGRITPVKVAELHHQEEPAPIVRVLTSAGEALLSAEAAVAGTAGSIPVHGLSGSGDRVEVIAPADLPPTSALPCVPLNGLLPGRFLIPLDNGAGEVLGGRIAAAAARLRLEVEQREEGRWLVANLAGVPSTFASWTWDDERDLLEALCGWEVDQGQVVAVRARLDQQDLRRRLFAAHTASGRTFQAEWLPGYLPVECRIRLGAGQRRPFVQADRVMAEQGPVVTLETVERCSLIVGPLIVRAKLVQPIAASARA